MVHSFLTKKEKKNEGYIPLVKFSESNHHHNDLCASDFQLLFWNTRKFETETYNLTKTKIIPYNISFVPVVILTGDF